MIGSLLYLSRRKAREKDDREKAKYKSQKPNRDRLKSKGGPE